MTRAFRSVHWMAMSIAVILAISAVETLVDSGDGGYGKICSNFNGIRM
jgi:hypothetical protein